MEVIATERERTCTLELRGELDHHSAHETICRMELAVESDLPKKLVLDFKGVTFMDSSGIALAVRAQRCMARLGGSAVLCHVPTQAKKVFDAAGIARMVPITQEDNV